MSRGESFRMGKHGLKIGDYGAVLLALIVLGLSVFLSRSHAQEPFSVRIESRESSWLYPLDQDRILQPLGWDGSCLIEIKDKQVRVVKSDCPRKICMSMGSLGSVGQWIACLPHGLYLTIEGPVSPSAGMNVPDSVAF